MARILNPQGRRRNKNEKTQQSGHKKDMNTETVGTHFVNGQKVFENKKDNHGFVFNLSR